MGRVQLESMGFIFSEKWFNESNQQCHMMMVTINATESVNGSRIRCDYCPTADQPGCRRSDEAILLVIAASNVFFYYKYRYDNIINI